MARKLVKEGVNRLLGNGEIGDAPGKVVEKQIISITPPKMQEIKLRIRGTAPFVQNRFSNKAFQQMREVQAQGSTSRKGKRREPKDFEQCYQEAKHISVEGWGGIPTTAFRSACVAACRLVGFKMTHAKLGVFPQADGYDRIDGTPLVKITKGEPHKVEHYVKNDGGSTDIRARPMWDAGWEADVRIMYDSDMFRPADIANLIARVGVQVGVGAGRPDSSDSCGCGWGTFEVLAD